MDKRRKEWAMNGSRISFKASEIQHQILQKYEFNVVLTDINISWTTAEKKKTINIAAVLFTPILMQGKYRCRTAIDKRDKVG